MEDRDSPLSFTTTSDSVVVNCSSDPIPTEKESKYHLRYNIFFVRFLKKLWTALKDTFSEYSVYSSIHGVRHLSHPVWYEKLIFNVFIVASIIACILIMRLVRYDRLESPIILSYDAKSMTIMEIPFPAITVCPHVKASHRKFNCAGQQSSFLGNFMKDQDM